VARLGSHWASEGMLVVINSIAGSAVADNKEMAINKRMNE